MNTIFKTTGLCVFLFACTPWAAAQNFSIDYPSYQKRNTDALEISRIVRNDTATILYMDAYSRPNYWIRLASELSLHGVQSGKKYPVIRSQGFELDKQVYMPASGNVTFTLQFAPIDPQDRTIDFVESNNEEDFRIEGICLDASVSKKKVHCHLAGKIANRPQTSRLILIESNKNTRGTPWISIPVRNGVFEYDFYTDHEKAYELICWDDLLNGCWYPVTFFAENGTVSFTISAIDARPPYRIETLNPLTTALRLFEAEGEDKFSFDELNARRDTLEKYGRFESEAMQALWKKFDQVKDNPEERNKLFRERDRLEESGEAFTEEAKALIKEREQLFRKKVIWETEQASQHPSLVGLFILKMKVENARKDEDVIPYLEVFQKVYASRYPEHPYTREMQMFIDNNQPKTGNRFIDFSAPDLNGNMVQLSEQIRGKVALIDLWASWCGPCRTTSKQLIPIYEKYKDRGFTVIGVAREQNSDIRMREAIRKDSYPWLNLIELNDVQQIWSKYRIPNAAGGTFLVNAQGIILAVNPTAEEVERILQKEL